MPNLESYNQARINNPALAQIRLLSERLDQEYQGMRDERQAIARWEEAQDFSILGIIDLYSTYVQGYAAQVVENRYPEPEQDPINHLRQLKMLEVSEFAVWYFNSLSQYPKVDQYVEMLDHLRLLLVEYMSQHSVQPAA